VDVAAATSSLELAEVVAPELRGLDSTAAFPRLEERYEELIAALERFLVDGGADEAIRLARALMPFWQSTRRLGEATEWFARALALPGGDDLVRGRGYVDAGFICFLRGDDGRATELFDHALDVGGSLAVPTVAALARAGLARIELRNGNLDEATRLCGEAYRLSEAAGDSVGRSSAAHILGVTAQMRGDLEEARRWMSERIALAREEGNAAAVGLEASNLAMVERQLGDFEQAQELLLEALDNFHRRRDEWAYPFELAGLAAVAVERGEYERAATLTGAADPRIEEQGVEWPPDERPHYDRTVAVLEASLDPGELERAREVGRSLTPDESVAYALGR
jgi:non-specific serine/threonine protein kinase